jgi:hypothetical protein
MRLAGAALKANAARNMGFRSDIIADLDQYGRRCRRATLLSHGSPHRAAPEWDRDMSSQSIPAPGTS